jgi:nucleolar protein 12
VGTAGGKVLEAGVKPVNVGVAKARVDKGMVRHILLHEDEDEGEEEDEDENEDEGNVAQESSNSENGSRGVQDSDSEVDMLHETLSGAVKKKRAPSSANKSKKYTPAEETPDQRDQRTIFVGNLSVQVAQKRVSRTFNARMSLH